MRILLAAVVTGLLSHAALAQAPAPDSLAQARQLTAWFFAGKMDSVLAHATPETRAELTVAELRARLDLLHQRGGHEVMVVEERFVRRNGRTQYWRAGWWSEFADETITLRLVLVHGMLNGMGVNPTSQNPAIDP